MTDSGVRQIARSVLIDTYSVKPISETDVDSLATKFPIIKNYVDKLRKNGNIFDPGLATVNGTIDTNLGLFRAYLCEWLLSHPSISSKDQILVRLMAPNEYGTPLQIWCFTSTNAWTAYEAIQSALFEHITVTAPLFGLNLYVYSSGQDALTVNLLKDSDASASPSQAQSQPQG